MHNKSKKSEIFNILYVYLIFNILYLIFGTSSVLASPIYPIPELGNCQSAQECFYYCQIPQNTPACWAYGKYIINSQVLGETDASASAIAQKFGITFPIAQLGNCADMEQCRQYCSLIENYTACSDFGLKKSLKNTRQATKSVDMKKILSYAKKDLRCVNESSCRQKCQLPQNHKLCREFAVKYKMQSDQSAEIEKTEIKLLGFAKNELGCASTDSCRLFCEDPVNRDRCSRFSRKFLVNPEASGAAVPKAEMLHRQSFSKPCANDESCRMYCQENPQECPGYSEIATSTAIRSIKTKPIFQSGDFLGPSGCKTEAECRDFCTKYPDKCPSLNKPSTLTNPTLSPDQ